MLPYNKMADDGVLKAEKASEEEEKDTGTQRAGDTPPHAYTADLPPDPDAHLSPEERAVIVSTVILANFEVLLIQVLRIGNYSGNST